MYERSYGYKYEEGGKLDTAAIAKLIRADIKREVAAGMLPARWRYSVTTDRFSGGSSIDVRVKDCADAWKPCDGTNGHGAGCANAWCKAGGIHRDSPHATEHEVLTEEAEAALTTLKRIHGAYNHDGSEVQTDYFDVNYYGQVGFTSKTGAEFEAREKARKEARRAALDAATDYRKVTVYGRRGSTTHVAAEVEGKLRLACGATLWRSSLVSAAREDAPVTCSRCAKRAADARFDLAEGQGRR